MLGGVVQAWSLATEMSFYLLLPLWAAAVARLGSARPPARLRWHLAGCAVLWLGGYASRVAIEAWWPAQRGLSFNWLPTNLDLFASGMALAVVSVWATTDGRVAGLLDGMAARVLPWWAAALGVFAWYAYAIGPADFATGYSGWFWHRRQLVLAVFTILLMVPAVFGDQTRGWARKAWSWRPIVFVGTVSYGLYLWHFDWMKRSIAGFDPFGGPTWSGWVHSPPGDSSFWFLLAVGVGVGMVFAAASWYLLEEPLQRFKDPRRALGQLRTRR